MLSDFPSYPTIPASDLQRAKRWYQDKLGITPVDEGPEEVRYETGGTRFVLFQSTGSASGTHTQLGWEVADIGSLVADLSARGVQFEEYDMPNFKTEKGIATLQGERGAWFKDSEGNLLAIAERLQG